MSLLREVAANFGGFSNTLDVNALVASITNFADLGASYQVLPATFPGGSVVLDAGVTAFTSLSQNPVTVLFDPATLYPGRMFIGAQSGAGTVAFNGVPGSTVTFYNVQGTQIVNGAPVVYMGGFGIMICESRTATTATIRTVGGVFGTPSLRIISASTTGTVSNAAGTVNVVSYATGPVTYQFDPATCCPFGNTIHLQQSGAGTLTLAAAPARTVIFLDENGAPLVAPVLNQGENITLVSVAHTSSSVTLQKLIFT